MQVDYLGQVAQVEAARASGSVQHVVLVSSAGGCDPHHFLNHIGQDDGGGDILNWKRKAEQHLITSGLTYTILHPNRECCDTLACMSPCRVNASSAAAAACCVKCARGRRCIVYMMHKHKRKCTTHVCCALCPVQGMSTQHVSRLVAHHKQPTAVWCV
jgi:hypothetical protein